jgi:hypothetical protein
VRVARLEDAIFNEEIEVAPNSSRSKGQSLPYLDRCRRTVFEDGASHRIAGSSLVDFHNSSVS